MILDNRYAITDMGLWIWDYGYGNTGIYLVSIWNGIVVMLMGWVWDYGHGIMDMGLWIWDQSMDMGS